MEAKVIKNIGSLVEGDILNYDKNEGEYYINKEEEVIEKESIRKKILKVTAPEWFIREHPSYFCFIDDKGSEVTIERIRYTPEEEEKNCCEPKIGSCNPVNTSETTINDLQKENEELKKKVKIMTDSILDLSNWIPRRWSLVW